MGSGDMRHVFGVVLAVVTAAAIFFGAGWAIEKITTFHASGLSLSSTHGVLAVAAALGVGLLLGVLVAVPGVSPLAAGLPGLALLGWSALLAASSQRATQLIPLHRHSYAAGFDIMLTTGVLALTGAVMIVPLFLPSRWRRRYAGDDYVSGIGLLR